MSLEETKKLLENEEDYIYNKKYENSLKKLIDKHKEGVSNKLIAQSLLMSEVEVETVYQKTILKIRNIMKVDID